MEPDVGSIKLSRRGGLNTSHFSLSLTDVSGDLVKIENETRHDIYVVAHDDSGTQVIHNKDGNDIFWWEVKNDGFVYYFGETGKHSREHLPLILAEHPEGSYLLYDWSVGGFTASTADADRDSKIHTLDSIRYYTELDEEYAKIVLEYDAHDEYDNVDPLSSAGVVVGAKSNYVLEGERTVSGAKPLAKILMYAWGEEAVSHEEVQYSSVPVQGAAELQLRRIYALDYEVLSMSNMDANMPRVRRLRSVAETGYDRYGNS